MCDAGFSGSEFGVQGIKISYLDKSTLTFTTFHQRCVAKLAFFMEVRLPLVLFALIFPLYASYYILSLSNERFTFTETYLWV